MRLLCYLFPFLLQFLLCMGTARRGRRLFYTRVSALSVMDVISIVIVLEDLINLGTVRYTPIKPTRVLCNGCFWTAYQVILSC